MDAIKMIPAAVLALVVGGLVIASGLKAMTNFKSSVCDYTYDGDLGACISCPTGFATYNETDNLCHNVSGSNSAAFINQANAEFNATTDAVGGTTEISSQFSTFGIIIAMVVLLAMIGGLVAYFGLR